MTVEAGEPGRGADGINRRAAAWVAWAFCGLSLALIACAAVLDAVSSTLGLASLTLLYVYGQVFAGLCALAGALVASRRAHNPVGWILLAIAAFFAREGLLDHRFDIEDAAADGDTVSVRDTCSGTHEGELWGLLPTGERFAARQSHGLRVADGKLTEHWAARDDLGMMRQLGVMLS
ncbi:MAG: ester cyclase [Rubrobacter sp.]